MSDLFPGEPDRYDRKQREWLDFFETIRVPGWVTPWHNDTLGNGTKMRDGNPIFSAVCPSEERGVRVIQWQPSSDLIQYDCYFDLFGQEGYLDEHGFSEEKLDLVLCCSTERWSEDWARERMKAWVAWDGKSPLPLCILACSDSHDWEKWWKSRKT